MSRLKKLNAIEIRRNADVDAVFKAAKYSMCRRRYDCDTEYSYRVQKVEGVYLPFADLLYLRRYDELWLNKLSESLLCTIKFKPQPPLSQSPALMRDIQR